MFSGLLLTLSAALLAFDRRVALVRLGLDLLGAGFVFMLLVPGGRAVVGLIPQTALRARPPRVCGTLSPDPCAPGRLCSADAVSCSSPRGIPSLSGSILFRPGSGIAGPLMNPPAGARGRLIRSALMLLAGACAMIWPATSASFARVVAVDFYRAGDLFRAVRKLGDEAAPVGH